MSQFKPWWQYLLDLAMGAITKGQLAQAGAGPQALSTAVTVAVPLPSGFKAHQPPAGISESRDLADCHPELARRYLALKAGFEALTGRQLFLTCTWRSAARQQELYRIGRRGLPGEKTVTQMDGVTKRSRHMVYPSEAVDVCVDIDPGPGKHPVWDRMAYAPLGPLAAAQGLVWGGAWRMDDYPHIELPAGVV